MAQSSVSNMSFSHLFLEKIAFGIQDNNSFETLFLKEDISSIIFFLLFRITSFIFSCRFPSLAFFGNFSFQQIDDPFREE
jgi:hypothetical protein